MTYRILLLVIGLCMVSSFTFGQSNGEEYSLYRLAYVYYKDFTPDSRDKLKEALSKKKHKNFFYKIDQIIVNFDPKSEDRLDQERLFEMARDGMKYIHPGTSIIAGTSIIVEENILQIDCSLYGEDSNEVFLNLIRASLQAEGAQDQEKERIYSKLYKVPIIKGIDHIEKCLQQSLEDEIDVNQPINNSGQTAMLWAAYYDAIDGLKRLIEQGGDPNLGYVQSDGSVTVTEEVDSSDTPLDLSLYWQRTHGEEQKVAKYLQTLRSN